MLEARRGRLADQMHRLHVWRWRRLQTCLLLNLLLLLLSWGVKGRLLLLGLLLGRGSLLLHQETSLLVKEVVLKDLTIVLLVRGPEV